MHGLLIAEKLESLSLIKTPKDVFPFSSSIAGIYDEVIIALLDFCRQFIDRLRRRRYNQCMGY